MPQLSAEDFRPIRKNLQNTGRRMAVGVRLQLNDPDQGSKDDRGISSHICFGPDVVDQFPALSISGRVFFHLGKTAAAQYLIAVQPAAKQDVGATVVTVFAKGRTARAILPITLVSDLNMSAGLYKCHNWWLTKDGWLAVDYRKVTKLRGLIDES